MLALARGFVSTEASAEDVVQDTWLAVIQGIDRFEGRSSLRTWVYRILVNTAKTRGVKEQRTLPWSSLPARTTGRAWTRRLFQGRRTSRTPAAGGSTSCLADEGGRGLGAGRGGPRASSRTRSTRCPSDSGP